MSNVSRETAELRAQIEIRKHAAMEPKPERKTA
jgi:hypothetical protein